ncbi:uncharacterized protein LOC119424274 [Nematolebias whitei]|uniref:uncharacterized protein LOC119424274 n=1 Tax=Nematolebias whitei TaxID=451745 RepID=UPI00189B62AE|nr:uncharacterized protein LOC119424274 [Nematolebias whitei]
MARWCCIKGCSSKTGHFGIKFFRFPVYRKDRGQQMEDLSRRRRLAWVAAVRRKEITFNQISANMRVCSLHFHKGQPAYEMMESDADWAPSLRLGHTDVKPTDAARYARRRKRDQQRNSTSQEAELVAQQDVDVCGHHVLEEADLFAEVQLECVSDPTDESEQIAEQGTVIPECEACALKSAEINRLREENGELRQQVNRVTCFEIFTERPSNVKARAQMFSSYKHNHTMKYLIGITPRGAICFLSKGWGGRTSDKHITLNSGFLDKLLPGDIVLADRGFDIQEHVGMLCAEVKLPAFTKGMCQLDAKNVEETRKIAHLRIHVERVIGNVCQKYKILSGTMPISLILPCECEDVTLLDKVVTVCCAFTNLCPTVIK